LFELTHTRVCPNTHIRVTGIRKSTFIMEKFYCRICGYRLGFEPWGDDGKTPTYEICPCCGVEFGNEDCTIKSIKEYRESWIKSGCKWFEQSKRATTWSWENQQRHLPKKFR